MYRIVYPFLFGASYLGTRFLGLERTVHTFRRAGDRWRRLGLARGKSPEQIRRALAGSYAALPLAVRCLDQALVTWHLLNLHGHPAEMKIGVTLSPFLSHAWVELGTETFVDFVYIQDMKLVASYPAWNGSDQ